MHVVLVEPEIPPNTGNVARLCAATHTELHLVKPLGFAVDDRHLKRAGLDYWPLVTVRYHDSFDAVRAAYPHGRFYFFSTKASRAYTEVRYGRDDFLVFGKETRGLPETLLQAFAPYCLRIPMIAAARCLNLSNSVAVVLYEALRQQGFPDLQ